MTRKPTPIDPESAHLHLGEKERSRRELQSRSEEINRVAKESAERRRLQSNADMEHKLREERRKPILEQTGLSPPVGKGRAERQAKRDAQKLADISVQLAKQRENARRARRLRGEYDGNNDPAPERLAKLEAEGKQAAVDPISPPITDGETLSTVKAHQTQTVVDFYKKRWTHEELTGARYLVRVFDQAVLADTRVTPAYDGMPVTAVPGQKASTPSIAKLAKEAAFADKKARRHEHWMSVEAILRTRFGEKGIRVVQWFVWETHRVAREGTPLGDQMVAAGKALAPFVEDEARLKGVALGWLQAVFRFAYGQWSVPEEAERRKQASRSTDEEIAARRRMRNAQIEHHDLVVQEEIAGTPMRVIKGGKD